MMVRGSSTRSPRLAAAAAISLPARGSRVSLTQVLIHPRPICTALLSERIPAAPATSAMRVSHSASFWPVRISRASRKSQTSDSPHPRWVASFDLVLDSSPASARRRLAPTELRRSTVRRSTSLPSRGRPVINSRPAVGRPSASHEANSFWSRLGGWCRVDFEGLARSSNQSRFAELTPDTVALTWM